MTTFGKAATVMLATAVVAIEAGAQAPAPSQPRPAEAKAPAPMQPYKRRSIVHHYPHPYPEMYHGDSRAGFRNPGGTGRYLEYYPAGDRFQANIERGDDPVRPAQFGGGGIPDRNEQLAAQQLGVAKYNAIQGHIDNMARPAFGYGFFGGFY
jgi:hypothetical protein